MATAAAMEACQRLAAGHVDLIRVADEVLAANAACISVPSLLFDIRRVGLPLNFDSARQELNFHALATGVLAAPTLGLGEYAMDRRLYSASGNDIADTVIFGLLGMHLAQVPTASEKLTEFKAFEVSQFLNVPLNVSVPISNEVPGMAEGIYVERPGPLAPLVHKLTEILNATGQAAVSRGHGDVAELVMVAAQEAYAGAGPGESAGLRLLDLLVERLPTLHQDELDVEAAEKVVASVGATAPSTAPKSDNSLCTDGDGLSGMAILRLGRAAAMVWELRNRLRAGRENSASPDDRFFECFEGLHEEDMLALPPAPTAAAISLLVSSGILQIDADALDRLREQRRAATPPRRTVVNAPAPGAGDGIGLMVNDEDLAERAARPAKDEVTALHLLAPCNAIVYSAAVVACQRLADALNVRAGDAGSPKRVSGMDVSKFVDFLARKARARDGSVEEPVQPVAPEVVTAAFQGLEEFQPIFLTSVSAYYDRPVAFG